MENVSKDERALALSQEDLIKRARAVSGSVYKDKMPFVPIVTINNKKEKKIVDIEGEKTEVVMPLKPGFNVMSKDESDEYTDELVPNLEGVIIGVRYYVESKYDADPAYRSGLFKSFKEGLTLRNRAGDTFFEGTYAQLKEQFSKDAVSKEGKAYKKKDFELYVYLYLDVDDRIVRFKWKMNSGCNWFDYSDQFGNDDTYLRYKTRFELAKDKFGDIEFYKAEAVRGEAVDLSIYLEKAEELEMLLAPKKKADNPFYPDADISSIPLTDPRYGEPKRLAADGFEIEEIPF